MRLGSAGDRLLQPAAAVAGARLHDDAADVRAERERDGVCTAVVTVSQGQAMNLGRRCRELAGATRLRRHPDQAHQLPVTSNTLNVDVPPLALYLAPAGVTDASDSRAVKFGTMPLDPGEDDCRRGRDARAERGRQAGVVHAAHPSTPFAFIAATTIKVPSARRRRPAPSDVTITGQLVGVALLSPTLARASLRRLALTPTLSRKREREDDRSARRASRGARPAGPSRRRRPAAASRRRAAGLGATDRSSGARASARRRSRRRARAWRRPAAPCAGPRSPVPSAPCRP